MTFQLRIVLPTFAIVICKREELQIFQSIIQLIVVDVIDVISIGNFPSEHFPNKSRQSILFFSSVNT